MTTATQPAAAPLTAAIPRLSGTLPIAALRGKIEIYRDDLGIPYVQAENEPDAFLAQGFVTAQDRLWQMEYDRLRGAGRWAEVVGDTALEQDKLMRRFRLTASAKADYAALDAPTRTMFDAYAAGVNAYINGPDPLPAEYEIAGIQPETWQPWHSIIVYKVRHILMGVFESKLWRARLVRALGPEKAGRLFPGYEPGHLLILPPGAAAPGPLDTGLQELAAGAAALNHLAEMDAGSNSWVLSGPRTASGQPLLAGDSHRALDTPNAYYQNRIACPEFDVIGLSFPGVPAFPHFGHNPWVCWSVTHTAADYQDLYMERLRGGDAGDAPQYLHKGQWHNAEIHHETVRSRSGRTESCRVVITNHGPLISGNPADAPAPGQEWAGLSLKYTATEIPPPADPDTGQTWPSILRRMLDARNADELIESQRGWVDPVNNFLFADTAGNIGYLCRGRIPVRPRRNGWLPVPGWTGEHEWQGDIPFAELPPAPSTRPRAISPPPTTAPVGDDYPHYLAIDFTPEFRVKSVTRALLSLDKPAAPDMAQVHAQRISLPALAYLAVLPQVEPQDAPSALALQRLREWERHNGRPPRRTRHLLRHARCPAARTAGAKPAARTGRRRLAPRRPRPRLLQQPPQGASGGNAARRRPFPPARRRHLARRPGPRPVPRPGRPARPDGRRPRRLDLGPHPSRRPPHTPYPPSAPTWPRTWTRPRSRPAATATPPWPAAIPPPPRPTSPAYR